MKIRASLEKFDHHRLVGEKEKRKERRREIVRKREMASAVSQWW